MRRPDAPVAPDAGVGVDVPPDAPPVPIDVREVVLDAPVVCTEASSCAAPFTCCNGICVDIGKDHGNCGACGQVCSASQFCNGMTCHEAVFANVCANPSAAVIKDQYEADNTAGATIGSALKTSCMAMVAEREQGAPDTLGPAGRPLGAGGITYVVGGGSFGQRSVDYLDRTAVTPVYITFDGKTAEFHARKTSEVVVTAPGSTLSDSHDYFFVQLAIEPQSGTLCLSVVGMLAGGTQAGAFWVAWESSPSATCTPTAGTPTSGWTPATRLPTPRTCSASSPTGGEAHNAGVIRPRKIVIEARGSVKRPPRCFDSRGGSDGFAVPAAPWGCQTYCSAPQVVTLTSPWKVSFRPAAASSKTTSTVRGRSRSLFTSSSDQRLSGRWAA